MRTFIYALLTVFVSAGASACFAGAFAAAVNNHFVLAGCLAMLGMKLVRA